MQTMYYNQLNEQDFYLFPHRSDANTIFDVASHLQKLVKENVETFESLLDKPYKHIFLEYLPKCSTRTLNAAFNLLRGLQMP